MKITECPCCGSPVIPSFGTTSRCDRCLRIFDHVLIPAGCKVTLETTEQGRLLDELARFVVDDPGLPTRESYSALLIAAWRSDKGKFERIIADHKHLRQEAQKCQELTR